MLYENFQLLKVQYFWVMFLLMTKFTSVVAFGNPPSEGCRSHIVLSESGTAHLLIRRQSFLYISLKQLNSLYFKVFLFNVNLFEREGEREEERERHTESEASSRLWAVRTEPNMGLELTNCEIMTRAKSDTCLMD